MGLINSIRIYNLPNLAIISLLLSLILDIGGGFGLKFICLVFAIFVGIYWVAVNGIYNKFLIDAAFVLFFISSALVSIIRGVPLSNALPEISFVVFFVILFLGKGAPPEFLESLLVKICLIGALIIISTFLIFRQYPEIGYAATNFAKEYRLGYLGFKSGSELIPNVYYRWSAWLLVGFSLSLYSRSYLTALLIGISAVMTLSTAIITGIFLILFLYASVLGRNSASRILGTLSLLFLSILLLIGVTKFFPYLASEFLSKFSAESYSTNVKLGHIVSILSVLDSDLLFLIFGQGVGTSFFSVGANEIVRDVEVSHFNLLRQFGLLGIIIFFCYFFYVVAQLYKLGKVGRPWVAALLVLFLVAGTNPLLMSPIFIVPLVMARIFSIEYRRLRRYE